ncbi:MBL fold metallo-hydrolase [Streptomyces sp. NPDC046915]|uniref:MBL fold metallo-hydrolase n=1 Tax=Streptomyces sp. NPDC046915 TaxID=3155257 RepID=UPI0033D82535
MRGRIPRPAGRPVHGRHTARRRTGPPARGGRLVGRPHARPHPGHLALWQPDERLLVSGVALSDYDVGWVSLALDGPGAEATALDSLERIAGLGPRVILPSHGPVPPDPGAAFATALRRTQRLVDDPAGAVRYGARRIFAFALMIRGGIPAGEVEPYLHARAWSMRVPYPRTWPEGARPRER